MKNKRQAKIYEIIQTDEIETQGELTRRLAAAGYDVTQATVSRDIHELKLTKVPSTGGGHKYAASALVDEQGLERSHRIFHDGLLTVDSAGNLLVIRTRAGMAMAVAAALDTMRFTDILGSIAGDDVVICVIRSDEMAKVLMEKLRK